MTISSTVRIAGPYIGSGAATVFPFAFKVFAAAEMQVAKLNTISNVETILVLNTDYTVQLNGDQNGTPGGTITLPAVLASGFNLTITSDIANLQPTDLTNQGGFYPEVITDALDRATIQIQQLDQNSRAIKIPLSDGVLDMTTPVVAARANKYLAFDAAGLPVVSAGTGSDPALRTDLANATAVSAGSLLSGFRQTGTGATARTVDAKLKETVSVKDFGAVGDGVTDDTAAIQAAIASTASGTILLSNGTYKISGTVTIPETHAFWFAKNAMLSFAASSVITIAGEIDAPSYQIFTGAALSTAPIFNNIGRLDIRWFGAKGDGVTNDTTAIQATINAAQRSDRAVVFLGSGIFVVNSSLLIEGTNLAITMTGTDDSGLQRGSTNSNTVILWTGGSFPIINIGSLAQNTYCNFYDLSFQNTGTATSAIYYSNNSAGNIRISRISTVQKSGQNEFSGPAIYLQGMNYGVISQVDLGAAKVAIEIDTSAGGGAMNIIRDSTFSYGSNVLADQYEPVIKLRSTITYAAEQLLVEGCTFNLKNGRSVIDNALALGGSNNITIRNCEINGTPSNPYKNVSGVKLVNIHDFKQLLIEDCYISQVGNASGTPCLVYAYTINPLIPLTQQSNIVIRNNTLVSNGDAVFVATDGTIRPTTGTTYNAGCPQYYVDIGYNLFIPGNHGQIISSGSADAYTAATVITVSIASPAVVTWAAHGLSANDKVKFTTTGSLPTGLVASTTYYVVAPAAGTFNVAATSGGAAIDTSGTQSGTHTANQFYIISDEVSSGGLNYYCVADTSGNAPPNATYWLPLNQITSAQYIPIQLTGAFWTVRGNLAPVDESPIYTISLSASPASATTIVVGTPPDSANAKGSMEIGQKFSVLLKNTSGGALANIAFGSQFKQPAVVLPATGFTRIWNFVYDGVNAIETGRTAADIPN